MDDNGHGPQQKQGRKPATLSLPVLSPLAKTETPRQPFP